MKAYSVWVGGMEVNDEYLTLREAEDLAWEYRDDGYDETTVLPH